MSQYVVPVAALPKSQIIKVLKESGHGVSDTDDRKKLETKLRQVGDPVIEIDIDSYVTALEAKDLYEALSSLTDWTGPIRGRARQKGEKHYAFFLEDQIIVLEDDEDDNEGVDNRFNSDGVFLKEEVISFSPAPERKHVVSKSTTTSSSTSVTRVNSLSSANISSFSPAPTRRNISRSKSDDSGDNKVGGNKKNDSNPGPAAESTSAFKMVCLLVFLAAVIIILASMQGGGISGLTGLTGSSSPPAAIAGKSSGNTEL